MSGWSAPACVTAGFAVSGLADDFHVGLRVENGFQALTDRLVVVGEQNTQLTHGEPSFSSAAGEAPYTTTLTEWGQTMADQNGSLIVGIGASAGGIQAVKRFLERVPADSGIAYVVVLHLSPEHVSSLAEVLSTSTTIPVTQVHRAGARPAQPRVRRFHRTGACGCRTAPSRYPRSQASRSGAHRSTSSSGRSPNPTGTAPSRSCCRAPARTGRWASSASRNSAASASFRIPTKPSTATCRATRLRLALVDHVLPVADDARAHPRLPRQPRHRAAARAEPADGRSPTSRRCATSSGCCASGPATTSRTTSGRRCCAASRGGWRLQHHGLAGYAQFVREHPEEPQALLKDLLISVTNFFRDRAGVRDARAACRAQALRGQGRRRSGACLDRRLRDRRRGLLHRDAARRVCRRRPGRPAIQLFATDIDETAIAIGARGPLHAERRGGRVARTAPRDSSSRRASRIVCGKSFAR